MPDNQYGVRGRLTFFQQKFTAATWLFPAEYPTSLIISSVHLYLDVPNQQLTAQPIRSEKNAVK
jgi:hypothetical protein